MTQRPTDLLREEHMAVKQKLDALERIILGPDGKAETSAELRELASFFQTDFWVHFAKEEEALFPQMEKFTPRQAGPLGVMLAEHEDLRRTNAEMQKNFAIYLEDSGNATARVLMNRLGSHFIGVLRDHIYKEDNILFGMAEMHLKSGDMESVSRVFQEIESRQGVTKGA
ncbi:MAG: hemerythrin domain-containing protein [Chloroflexi bacterium]|nr:hemerythrin domain-containing protein [Chloroflexota bacterium]